MAEVMQIVLNGPDCQENGSFALIVAVSRFRLLYSRRQMMVAIAAIITAPSAGPKIRVSGSTMSPASTTSNGALTKFPMPDNPRAETVPARQHLRWHWIYLHR